MKEPVHRLCERASLGLSYDTGSHWAAGDFNKCPFLCQISGSQIFKKARDGTNITKTARLPVSGTSHSTNKKVFECLCLNPGYIFKKKSGNKRKQERIRKTVPDCAPLYRGMRKGDLRLLTAEGGITLLF